MSVKIDEEYLLSNEELLGFLQEFDEELKDSIKKRRFLNSIKEF